MFIISLFSHNKRSILPEAVDFIIEWTHLHTFYTQQLCHTIYDSGAVNIGLAEVKNACAILMQQGEAVYLQYCQMLTDKQWNFMIAIAKEGSIIQITSSEFLRKYKIDSPSTSRKQADSLCAKGLLNAEPTLQGTVFTVDDVFFLHWLERL